VAISGTHYTPAPVYVKASTSPFLRPPNLLWRGHATAAIRTLTLAVNKKRFAEHRTASWLDAGYGCMCR